MGFCRAGVCLWGLVHSTLSRLTVVFTQSCWTPDLLSARCCTLAIKLLASSENGRMGKRKKKKTLKAFYLPIKMSQAVNAQTSLPFVGLATMLQ